MEANTLPEFAFIDGSSHLGDLLENRTLVLHVPSRSIFECIYCGEDADSEFKAFSTKDIVLEFDYANLANEMEEYVVVLHSSDLKPIEIADLMEKLELWLINYFDWEDHNSMTTIQSSMN